MGKSDLIGRYCELVNAGMCYSTYTFMAGLMLLKNFKDGEYHPAGTIGVIVAVDKHPITSMVLVGIQPEAGSDYIVDLKGILLLEDHERPATDPIDRLVQIEVKRLTRGL